MDMVLPLNAEIIFAGQALLLGVSPMELLAVRVALFSSELIFMSLITTTQLPEEVFIVSVPGNSEKFVLPGIFNVAADLRSLPVTCMESPLQVNVSFDMFATNTD